jgi:DNA-binding transcriptional regulator YbjK
MADIQGWLRGFQRSRIPNATTLSDRLSLLDEVNEAAEEMHSAPSTSRMSYYQNFGRLTAQYLSTESQPHLNQVEQIWHNPDPDQMAETLKVAMMTQNSFDPLRVSFNSCILHVLEAYQRMQKELIERDREIRDREQRHENDIKEFTQQKLQWKRKEDEYKSEMKKLEVMVATGARGLELVMLARSRSALNGTTRAEAIESELQRVASDKGSLFKAV